MAWCWNTVTLSFLGTFAKLREKNIPFILTVCLSVRKQQLGSHWTNFYKILYLSVFRKSVQKIQVSLKSDKSNGYFTLRTIYISHSLLRMRNVSHQICREIKKTHIQCSITFFLTRAFYEIMRENIVEPDRLQVTIKYGTCTLHAGYLGLQTHTQNM